MIDLKNALANTKLYEIPLTVIKEGAEIQDPAKGLLAFKYAGNWYVTPKANSSVRSNPAQWSLVTNDLNPNFRHYHATSFVEEIPKRDVEAITGVAKNLELKREAGSLAGSEVKIAPDLLANIVLSKEKEGAGFRLNGNEPLEQFLDSHGLKQFELNESEIAAHHEMMKGPWKQAYEEELRQTRKEMLALKSANGEAFMAVPKGGVFGQAFGDPKERVFYSIVEEPAGFSETPLAGGREVGFHAAPEKRVRRLKVGFDEALSPDGKRSPLPVVSETEITLSKALEEIGENHHMAHAPDGISAYFKGDHQGIQRYAKSHMAVDYAGREYAHDVMSKQGHHQAMLDHGFGEKLKAKELTTQAWYRVNRPEDYVMQQGDIIENAEGAVGHTQYRILDKNRADYFIIREHPELTASYSSGVRYEGPQYELLHLKGNPSGGAPSAIEILPLKDEKAVFFELNKRGIHADANIIKIGEDEYADLFNQRGLKDHINHGKLLQQSVRDTAQIKPLAGYAEFSHPLNEPISMTGTKLSGDLEGLRVDVPYLLGDERVLVLQQEGSSFKTLLFSKEGAFSKAECIVWMVHLNMSLRVC